MKLIAMALALSLMFATGAYADPYGTVRCPPGNERCVAAFKRLYKAHPTARHYNRAARRDPVYQRNLRTPAPRVRLCRLIKHSQYTYRWDCM